MHALIPSIGSVIEESLFRRGGCDFGISGLMDQVAPSGGARGGRDGVAKWDRSRGRAKFSEPESGPACIGGYRNKC